MEYLVNVVIPPLHQPLTYFIPEEWEGLIDTGYQVEVPLGKRQAQGYVISKFPLTSFDVKDDYEVKSLSELPLQYRSFDPKQLPFFQWIAEYYGDSLANVLDVAIPKYAPPKLKRLVHLEKNSDTNSLRGLRQKEILSLLIERKEPILLSELSRRFKGVHGTLKSLESRGVISITTEEVMDHHLSDTAAPSWAKSSIELNEQQTPVAASLRHSLDKGTSSTFLLHGVTGSGKTEVYLDAILHAQSLGKSSLLIVPEIALTPQLVDRFRARLGPDLALLHSGLSTRARWDSWRALLENRCHVAIGARSGIFAPIQNLGLILVDEEHDHSFKQSEGLRYNARDLAVMRGKFENAVVVLGSATPSLETLSNALKKKYTYLSLEKRHSESEETNIEVVDLTQVKRKEMISPNISPRLFEELTETLSKDEQAFILYNKRGFASYLQCEKCEEVMTCPNCSVTFTFHQHRNQLLCHYCNLHLLPPEFCPACLSLDLDPNIEPPGKLVPRGSGTEKVYNELCELLPNAIIDRLDRDTANNLQEYRDVLDRVRSGETDILVGTQMIAKGHDLPGVTFVGVVDCDVGLHFPDFRASERAFQLLTQVAGRAGRGTKSGRVILQTRVPEHSSIVMTKSKNFLGFAKQELEQRQALSYPPFSKMLRIVSASQDQSIAFRTLEAMRAHTEAFLEQHNYEILALGPTPTPIERVKTQWRFHMLFKAKSIQQLNHLLRELRSLKLKTRKVRVTYDLDPYEML
ncbi:MAG: primosomal protein N' [Bdellovibrionales bacterium]|nr:primosomal protein N' [Bdellovibrionales bacterium]